MDLVFFRSLRQFAKICLSTTIIRLTMRFMSEFAVCGIEKLICGLRFKKFGLQFAVLARLLRLKNNEPYGAPSVRVLQGTCLTRLEQSCATDETGKHAVPHTICSREHKNG